jgi:hypothetical protein
VIRNLYLIISLFLVGCATQTDSVVQDAPPVAIPQVAPMTLNPVQWKVMTLADMQALEAQLKKTGKTDIVIFTLDTDNYQNLNLNFVEIQRYLTQQKAVVVLLKKIVDQNSGVINSKNKLN